MPRSGGGALLPPLIFTHYPRKGIASQQADRDGKAQHANTHGQHLPLGSAALPGPTVGLQALGRGASLSQVCQTPATTHGSGHSHLWRGTVIARSDQGSPHPVTHIQTHAGTLGFAPAILYWTKAYAGTGSPTTCTHMAHAVGTRNPLRHLVPHRAHPCGAQDRLPGTESPTATSWVRRASPLLCHRAQWAANLLPANPRPCWRTGPGETSKYLAWREEGSPHIPELEAS